MKNMIIGTVSLILVGIFITIFFFENHPELTTLVRKQQIEENDTEESELPPLVPLQPIYVEDSIGYSLQNDQLQVTFNKGSDWSIVPVEKEKLFSGEYSGNKQE
jgi:hypothetical protein